MATTPLKEGAKAPAFKLPRDGGGSVSLPTSRARSSSSTSIPRADTPGCTREAIDFSKLGPAFAKAGTEVIGVSADPVKAQDAFKNKHELSIALALGRNARDARGLWRLGQEIDVRQEFMGICARPF